MRDINLSQENLAVQCRYVKIYLNFAGLLRILHLTFKAY